MAVSTCGLLLTPEDLTEAKIPQGLTGRIIPLPRNNPARQESLISMLARAPVNMPRLVCKKVGCERSRDAGNVVCDRCAREEQRRIRSEKIQKTKRRNIRKKRRQAALLKNVLDAAIRAYRNGTLVR